MKTASCFAGMVALSFLMLTACKKEKPEVSILSEENQWILDSMQVYYYWNKDIPAKPRDQADPSTFFTSLLNSSDRFSSLEDPQEVKTSYSSFAYYGLEYALLEIPQLNNRLVGVVTLVVPGSSAFKKGLRRGAVFLSVNDQEISTENLEEIEQQLKQGNGIRLRIAELSGNQLVEKEAISVPIAHFKENPVYIAKVFENGAKKKGYLFYNYFEGSADQKLMDSLMKLKTAGISELILDMRYNPGGDVSSAAKLVAALAPVSAGEIFVTYQANANGGRIDNSFERTMQENNHQPNNFSIIKAHQLNLERVIVLTTRATASAAELVINGLKPYVPVIQIGQTTIGKDMASFAINDQRTPKKFNIVLHPLIFKLYNANGEGDYPQGIIPDLQVDEFSQLPLNPFGNRNDPLIKAALSLGEVSLTGALKQTSDRLSGRSFLNSASGRSEKQLPIIVKSPF